MVSVRRVLLVLCPVFAAVLAPQTAMAQAPTDATGATSEDSVNMPNRITAEMMAFNSTMQFRLPAQQAQTCFATGCLFVVNDTSSYDAVGLFLDTGSPDVADAPVWSPNVLAEKLAPKAARWTFKSGDRSTCAVGAMVVLRHRETGAELTTQGQVSLCKSPRRDSALRIKVVEPQVILHPEDKG